MKCVTCASQEDIPIVIHKYLFTSDRTPVEVPAYVCKHCGMDYMTPEQLNNLIAKYNEPN